MKLAEIRTLTGAVWFLILGTAICKAAYFISMPFLAVRMKTELGLDPVSIGLALGAGPMVGILAGFYVGHLSDRWGRKHLFAASIFVWSATFVGFAFATRLWQYALFTTLNGLCNSATHPVTAALISDLTPAASRKSAFHLRYYAINVGATFGPALGAWLLIADPKLGFLLTALTYLIYGIACLFWLPADDRKPHTQEGGSFAEVLKAISEDSSLLLYTAASVLMGLTYSQLESTLPQYLHALQAEEGLKLFGILMGINALTVVFVQLPLTRLTSRFSLNQTVQLGALSYGIGLALFSVLPVKLVGLGPAMVVLTLGEILIFSNNNLLIDRIAPENRKGAYFGASGLWAVGATLGPAVGGWILMRLGGPVLFAALGALALCKIVFYRAGGRAERPTQALGLT